MRDRSLPRVHSNRYQPSRHRPLHIATRRASVAILSAPASCHQIHPHYSEIGHNHVFVIAACKPPLAADHNTSPPLQHHSHERHHELQSMKNRDALAVTPAHAREPADGTRSGDVEAQHSRRRCPPTHPDATGPPAPFEPQPWHHPPGAGEVGAMSSTKRGGGRRGRGRGRGAVAKNDMDHLETSAPSSPSTTSDREENAILIPRQSPACYVGPSELSSTLLNPKINHRSDAIFGDQDARGPAMPGKSFLHYKWLKKNFYELPEEADDITVERHVRAYILSLLCGVLFPDGTGRMSLIYLPLIADLSRVSTYSWGSAVLAFLYRSLCSVASSHNIKNIGETGIEQDLPPIGFRWVGARTQSDNATRSLKQYRDELNLQRVDQEWEARRQRIFRDTEQYDPSSYEEYLSWYSGATRRYLVPATSDDAEAEPLHPAGDSLDHQYQAKSPLIRKAVDKLEGMVKRAKTAMTSTADTTTQALVAEFLHGFQDVLQDLSEIDNSPHVDIAASEQTPQVLVEEEENIDANLEDQQQEDEELNTVEHASLTLEPMDEENNLSNNVLSEHPSLGVEENCDSAAPATENYDTATAATDLVHPSEDLQQDEDQEEHPEMEQTIFLVEPKCEEDDGSNFVLPSSPPELMLEEQDESANPAEQQGDLAALGTESCTVQQSLEAGEAEDQENPNTAEHDGMMVEHTDEENNNNCNGVSSSCPPPSAIVDPVQIEQ
ncbi:hypothetical protein BAE44_0003799 [Dichanthelium oligosanthes]|uniref:Aminotransferase-like plant mobile domain-containing protein n=1 Tax=Dichanthelium oligosanthes TaxID=888268 RepID=A0A1E5WCT5_9POAL|nr:hypothetical protein BAE44_0003799 [Dichanthelium oligosanthes]